jgi:signal transduction histidine kinase
LPLEWHQPIAGVLDTGLSQELEVEISDRTYTFTISSVLDRECVYLYGRDITEQRQLELQFRRAQKMEAVGRLAGGIAHDFKNLLTVIQGYSELLLRELDRSHPLRQDVETILQANKQATRLIRQLLAFSRTRILKPQIINLNNEITNLEKMLRHLIADDIELVTLLEPALGYIKADAGQIEQVILNLVINARDAMPHGGKLPIETNNISLDQSYARQHFNLNPGPYVRLAVSDTGTGMNTDVQAHIFEPFFTTKERGKGTGLGLFTVYGIITRSGGSIHVYSKPGQGTSFEMYLPKEADHG